MTALVCPWGLGCDAAHSPPRYTAVWLTDRIDFWMKLTYLRSAPGSKSLRIAVRLSVWLADLPLFLLWPR